MATFAERHRMLREELGISQVELAKRVHLSNTTISQYEGKTDREPGPRILRVLAAFFGVTIDYLLGRTDDPRPNQVRETTPAWPVGGDVTPEEREHLRRYLAWRRREEAERKER